MSLKDLCPYTKSLVYNLFKDLKIWLCTYVCGSEARVTGICKLTGRSVGSKTLVLWKKQEILLTAETSLQPHNLKI